MVVNIFFDGACDNNSLYKLMGLGVAVYFGDDEYKEEYSVSEFVGTNGTSNIAEWEALCKALRIAKELVNKYKDITIKIFGDSQVIVRQFNGVYQVRKHHFIEYYKEAQEIAKELGNKLYSVKWISRKFNTQADELSTKCVTEFIENKFSW